MNLVSVYQDFKQIYGICPCCGDLFRLSDATIFARKAPPRTVFDELRDQSARVEARRERFEGLRDALRHKARLKGQVAAQNRLKRLSAFFMKRKINLRDVKVMFDPVDYVVFRGLCTRECTEAVLIDREPDSSRREKVQNSLERSIRRGNLEWKTVRIADDGSITLE